MSMIDQPGKGYLTIVGFLRNIGNDTYDNVGFTVIDVAEGFPSTSDAQIPGGIASFKFPVSTPPAKLDH